MRRFLFYLLLLATLASCSRPDVKNTFPFRVYARPEPIDWGPSRQYGFDIMVPVGELAGYGDLFNAYGYEGNGHSWAEHVRAILRKKDPALLGV